MKNDWKLNNDWTVATGGEVDTPVLYDNYSTWYEIADVCDILNKYSIIGENCGGHIHIGS